MSGGKGEMVSFFRPMEAGERKKIGRAEKNRKKKECRGFPLDQQKEYKGEPWKDDDLVKAAVVLGSERADPLR